MCVSNGAPNHPNGLKVNDDVRSGANALWDLCQKHNAVFLADSDFQRDLEKFLKEHRITRSKTTDKQKQYVSIIEKGMKASPSIVA